MPHHQGQGSGQPEHGSADQAEKNRAHVHRAGKAKQPAEIPLLQGRQTEIENVAGQEQAHDPSNLLPSLGGHRQGHPHQSIEAELFQHPGVQHGGRRGSRGVTARRPAVERHEGNQGSEPDQQQRGDDMLDAGGQGIGPQGFGQHPPVETPGGFRQGQKQPDQTDQQHHAAQHEIHRHAPSRPGAIPVAPHSHQKEGRNQRHLVEREEIKEVDGEKGAQGPHPDQKQADVVLLLPLDPLPAGTDGRQRDQQGEPDHGEAEPIHAENEFGREHFPGRDRFWTEQKLAGPQDHARGEKPGNQVEDRGPEGRGLGTAAQRNQEDSDHRNREQGGQGQGKTHAAPFQRSHPSTSSTPRMKTAA